MKKIIIPILFLFSTISFGQKKNSNEDLISYTNGKFKLGFTEREDI